MLTCRHADTGLEVSVPPFDTDSAAFEAQVAGQCLFRCESRVVRAVDGRRGSIQLPLIVDVDADDEAHLGF